MFEILRNHPRILVVGPHRSGTTITTEMIAHDTGHQAVREEEWGRKDFSKLNALMDAKNVVIQAPHATSKAWKYYDKALIMLVVRPIADIMDSVDRLKVSKPRKHPSEVYRQFRDQRTPHIKVKYNDLSGHPLWVPKEERVDWHHRQTCGA